jgi:hypothetical protein
MATMETQVCCNGAGLTDHIWTIEELMMTVVIPDFNTK